MIIIMVWFSPVCVCVYQLWLLKTDCWCECIIDISMINLILIVLQDSQNFNQKLLDRLIKR